MTIPRQSNILVKTRKHLRAGTFFSTARHWITNKSRQVKKVLRRKRWKRLVAQKKNLVVQVGQGACLELTFDSRLSMLIYCDDFESQEREFVSSYLKAGDTFVDIGANIGLYTVLGGRAVGATGKVYAFEPCKNTFDRLVENVKRNNIASAKCFQLAVSSTSGKATFYTATGGWDAWNSLGYRVAGLDFVAQDVSTTTFEEFLQAEHLVGKVNLVKLDAEGWEHNVIESARPALERGDAPDFILEFNEDALAAAGSSCSALARLLKDLGYKLYKYSRVTKEIVEVSQSPSSGDNLIASKAPERIRRRLAGLPWES